MISLLNPIQQRNKMREYVETREDLTQEELEEGLKEILKRRFDGLLTIEYNEEWQNLEVLYDNGMDPDYSFELSLVGNRKIEFNTPRADWMMWAEVIIRNELAVKYKGKIHASDFEKEKRWDGNTNLYPSYFSWLEWYFEEKDLAEAQKMVHRHMSALPAPIKQLEKKLRGFK